LCQALRHFMHDAPWDAEALNQRRLKRWRAHPSLGPDAHGVLIADETGDPKRGSRIVLAAQQYLGKLGHVATGVVAVTSHWANGPSMSRWESRPTGWSVACPTASATWPSTPRRSWPES
jgi:SRSO17 transposase